MTSPTVRCSLSAIFLPVKGLEKLPSLLRQTATSMRGSIGQTDLTALPADDNFCVNGDGEIVFVYQPYEIASYAQGIIRIPGGAYILSDYFTPYGNKLLMGVGVTFNLKNQMEFSDKELGAILKAGHAMVEADGRIDPNEVEMLFEGLSDDVANRRDELYRMADAMDSVEMISSCRGCRRATNAMWPGTWPLS